MLSFKRTSISLLIATASLATTAIAAPVTYSFATAGPAAGAAAITSLLGDAPTVSGTFTYNAESVFYGRSGDLGYESGYSVYIGTDATNLAFSALSGSVAGHAFSDSIGTANVGNNLAGGNLDALTLHANPSLKVGANTPSSDSDGYPFNGFTIGAYSLINVRIIWFSLIGGAGNFLNDSNLPQQLPTFRGRLALDFALTDDPTNLAGVPFYSNTLIFDSLYVQATPVPEPTSYAMFLLGLTGLMAVARLRKAAKKPV